MEARNLTGFGLELKEVFYKDTFDWLIRFNDCANLWKAQPTYLIVQTSFLLGGLITLIHSLKKGGRWPWLWVGTVCHGLFVELVCYNLPDVDNFWHSQTPIIFFGNRLPLHIITLYPVFIYNAVHAISKAELPTWAEPFAVGLTVVLIDIPYDIVSVKFLHWTWHDTDNNIADRHYWVPWNSYYFHTTFALSFTFWFLFLHKFSKAKKWESSGFFKELAILLITSILGTVGGVLLFVPLYHPLHDNYGIHSEVTYFILFAICLIVAWVGDRKLKNRSSEKSTIFDGLLLLHLIAHYSIFFLMTVFGNPENEVSMGLHETIGPCTKIMDQRTPFGKVLKRREYLCVEDYDEDYFTFSCLPEGKRPSNGASWYTVCGTPFENRYEYMAVIGLICFLAFMIFSNLYCSNCHSKSTTITKNDNNIKKKIKKN